MSSQNVVSYVKKVLNVDKAGHTGTLDPGAAGVLPVCTGKATRVTEYLLNDKKSYRAELQLGLKSDTLDKYGVIEDVAIPHIENEDIYKAFEKFKGNIEQLPPMFSALKVKGKKLYELARQGIEVERKRRRIFIYDLSIVNIDGNRVLFDVTCSKGTYIRTLCSDIGKELGSDAIMTFLIRTKTGHFEIDNAVTLDELKNAAQNGEVKMLLHNMDEALIEYDRIYVDKSTSKKVLDGVGFFISMDMEYEKRNLDDVLLIYDDCSNFIAIGDKCSNNGFVKIGKVFV